jgi:hypothetical protein
MVRNGHNVSICIWYEMVIMYRSAYGTKWQWYELVMVRNGNGTKWLWYEMAMVRNGYSTKMIFTMVRNGRYEMVMVRNDCNSFLHRKLFVFSEDIGIFYNKIYNRLNKR